MSKQTEATIQNNQSQRSSEPPVQYQREGKLVAKAMSAMVNVRHPKAHQIKSDSNKINTQSMPSRIRICVRLAGARLLRMVPRIFHTGVPL